MHKLTLLTLLCIAFATLAHAQLTVNLLGRYTDGRIEALEIATYDSASARIFITNAATDSIDIVDISNANSPVLVGHIDVLSYGGGVNSVVALGNGYLAAAIEADPNQNLGKVVFYDTNGNFVAQVTVGALPDMITVTPDGTKVLTANEGEPNDAYDNDPEGSISIIGISGGVPNVTQNDVTTLNFANAPATIAGSLLKPNTTYQYDLEPEYIAINQSSTLAAVICQENNVLIMVDLTTNSITNYYGLGFKDHSLAGNGFDASNLDSINIKTHPVKGVYQPDAIYAYTVNGNTYIVSANEGDARDYDGYSSQTRIKNLVLDSLAFPDAELLQQDSALGRLNSFTADMIGDTDGDGDVDELYSYGARSFSIWDTNGQLVWDSGDDFEQYIAANFPTFFNCDDGLASEMDARSDDKGPEPEAITVGQIGTRFYAFIGLERQGGIMIYDVTDPTAPTMVDFVQSYDVATGTMTDIAPEGIVFIPASKSHTNTNLLLVSHEVSGTTAIYEVQDPSSTRSIKTGRTFKVFPNPSTEGMVYFETVKTIRVFDMLGNQIETVTNTNQINTAVWAAGTYIFVDETGATQRFVKL
jgi:hypothetical protein